MTAQNKPMITKEWLANKIKLEPERVIGRILCAIYKHQTFAEQTQTTTKVNNGIGFCKPDARVGSIGARMYNSKGRLAPWVIQVWSRPTKDGFPRICKYANQLNDIAQAKKRELQQNESPNFNVVIL